jgi:hypothetical protein
MLGMFGGGWKFGGKPPGRPGCCAFACCIPGGAVPGAAIPGGGPRFVRFSSFFDQLVNVMGDPRLTHARGRSVSTIVWRAAIHAGSYKRQFRFINKGVRRSGHCYSEQKTYVGKGYTLRQLRAFNTEAEIGVRVEGQCQRRLFSRSVCYSCVAI